MPTPNIRSIDEIVTELRHRAASHDAAGEVDKASECRNLIDKSINGGRLTGTKHLELYKRFELWVSRHIDWDVLKDLPDELAHGIASALNGSSHWVDLEAGIKYGDPELAKISAAGLIAANAEYAEDILLSRIRTKDIVVRTTVSRALKGLRERTKIRQELLRGLRSTVPEFKVACADALAGSEDLEVQRALAKGLTAKHPKTDPKVAFDYFPYDDSARFQRDACYPRNPVRYSFAKALSSANSADSEVIARLARCLKEDEHMGVKIRCAEALRGVTDRDALAVLNTFCTGEHSDTYPVLHTDALPFSSDMLETACMHAICASDLDKARSLLQKDDVHEASIQGALLALHQAGDLDTQQLLVKLCKKDRFYSNGDLSAALGEALQGCSSRDVQSNLITLLKHGSLAQKTLAATALTHSSLPEVTTLAADELKKQLDDYDQSATEAFIGVLHGTTDREGLAALVAVLSQTDAMWQPAAILAADALSTSQAPEALATLLEGLSDNRYGVRTACALALQNTRNLDVISALIDNLYAKKNPAHLAASALALKGQFGPRGWSYDEQGISHHIIKQPLFEASADSHDDFH